MIGVSIVQPYIPGYRVPFFDELHRQGLDSGFNIQIHAGSARAAEAFRGDAVKPDSRSFYRPLAEVEMRFLRRRVAIRDVREAFSAPIVVLEQARRNLDVYGLFLPKRFRGGKQVALWGHGFDHVVRPTSLESAISRRLLRRCDHFFSYTEGGAVAVRRVLPAPRVTVLNNSVDTVQLRRDLEEVSDEEHSPDWGNQRLPTIGYIGGLDSAKGIEILLAAHEHLGRQVRLLIAGDGELRDSVMEYCSSAKNAHYVGSVAGKRKARLLREVDALTIPGRVGLIAVDSVVSGVPIVTCDDVMHAPEFEYVKDLCVIASADPVDYSSKVASFLFDSPVRAEVRTRLLSRRDQFGVEQMAERFLSGLTAIGQRSGLIGGIDHDR